MRRSLLLSAAVLLTLSACATLAPPETITTPVTYDCAKGRRFTATYPARGDRAIIVAGGVTQTLPRARSGSGARYAKGKYEIWGKGDAATLSGFPGGPYDACQAR